MLEEITSVIGGVRDLLSNIGAGYRGASDYGGLTHFGPKAYEGLANITLMWKDIDEATSKFVKSMGLSSKSINEIHDNLSNIANDSNLGGLYGVTTSKLLEMQKSFDDVIGRTQMFDKQSSVVSSQLYSIFNNDDKKVTELTTAFNSIGISMLAASDYAKSMYKTSGAAGISFEKYSKNILSNFKLVQKYNFKDGVEGLQNMVKKSMELNFNIKQAEGVAKNIWDGGFSKATEYSAKLQVLGGSFAQIADPISLMYDSFNDLESLQDSIMSIATDKAYFNEKTGQMEMGVADKQLLYQAAKGIGVDYNELINTAYRQGIRSRIDSELNHTTVDKELRELIMNVGEIRKNENGTFDAGAVIDGVWRTADEISNNEELRRSLISQSQTTDETLHEIAFNTAGILKKIENGYAGFYNKIDKDVSSLGKNIKETLINEFIGINGKDRTMDLTGLFIGRAIYDNFDSILGVAFNTYFSSLRNRGINVNSSLGSTITGIVTNEEQYISGFGEFEGFRVSRLERSTRGAMYPNWQWNGGSSGGIGGARLSVGNRRNGGTISTYSAGGEPYGSSETVAARSNEGILGDINAQYKPSDDGVPGKFIIANVGETIMSEPATRSFYNTLQSMNDNPLNQTDILKSLLYDLSYGGNVAYNQPVMEVSSNYNGNVVTPHYSNSYNSDNSVSIKPIDFNINVSGNFDMKMPDGSTMNNLLDIRLLSELLFKTPEFRDYIMRITNEELVYKIKGLMTTNTLLS